MVIADIVTGRRMEFANAETACRPPHALRHTRSEPQAVFFDKDVEIPVPHHVDEHSGCVLVSWWMVAVFTGKVRRTVKVLPLLADDEFFAVEEYEIDAAGQRQTGHVVSELH